MSIDKGPILIALARQSITEQLGLVADALKHADADWLHEHAATFVTLTRHGGLRGCIGTLEAYRALIDDVQANAVAAAFHDPRFSPVSADELASVRIEISLLTAMQPLLVGDESEAMATIRPGMDGVVLQYGYHKGTFLPQVWEQLPDPVQFMAHLKQKSGLAADFWHPDVRLFTYQVDKFRERKVE